jgi:hypothetical protein
MRFSVDLVLLSASTALIVAGSIYFVWKRMRHKEDPETLRRLHVDANGRIIEGTVTDIRDGLIYYSWNWRGVIYEASQDVTSLSQHLPPETHLLIGQTSIKFLPRNPHNSIVMSENWSGFRLRKLPVNDSTTKTPHLSM